MQPLSNKLFGEENAPEVEIASRRAGGSLGAVGLLLWILTDRDICISGVILQHEETAITAFQDTPHPPQKSLSPIPLPPC